MISVKQNDPLFLNGQFRLTYYLFVIIPSLSLAKYYYIAVPYINRASYKATKTLQGIKM